VSDSATQLAIEVGSATAPAVTELSYALIGLTEASLDAAKSMGTGASEGLGFALGKTLDVMRQKNVAVALLAGGLDMLAERGREAAAAVGGITNPNDTLTGTAMMQALGLVATNEEEKAYFAEREQRQKDAAAEREREREKALRAEIEQRTREAQEFAAGAEQYRQVWREAYKGRLADADALWEAQQQDSADAIALISAESKASDEAWGEQQDRLAQEAEAAKDLANKWAQSYAMQRDAAQTSADAAIELLGTLLGESKEAAILMLALRKAQAIAEIVINTQVASSAALALGPAAPPAIAAIQAAGVAQIATVAATGIAEGIGIAASGQQGAQNQTFNLVVDSRAVRGGVRQHGTAGRRPAGQR
jgi:hypothetical protein